MTMEEVIGGTIEGDSIFYRPIHPLLLTQSRSGDDY